MKLTISQALQKGVEAHRGGRLQEAERFYRAILGSQPSHPDANHNLGVLTASCSKFEEALPLFKTALKSNPNIDDKDLDIDWGEGEAELSEKDLKGVKFNEAEVF